MRHNIFIEYFSAKDGRMTRCLVIQMNKQKTVRLDKPYLKVHNHDFLMIMMIALN